MKISSLLYFSIFCVISMPSFLRAQGNHTGNTCAVMKSPYRLSMDSGKKIYAMQCLSCHQADGAGMANTNPPLTGKKLTGDKRTLIEIVINGLATHEEIAGHIYQNVMPASPGMKDQEIADVLTYIRNSFGNKAPSVKPSEVKSARSKLKYME